MISRLLIFLLSLPLYTLSSDSFAKGDKPTKETRSSDKSEKTKEEKTEKFQMLGRGEGVGENPDGSYREFHTNDGRVFEGDFRRDIINGERALRSISGREVTGERRESAERLERADRLSRAEGLSGRNNFDRGSGGGLINEIESFFNTPEERGVKVHENLKGDGLKEVFGNVSSITSSSASADMGSMEFSGFEPFGGASLEFDLSGSDPDSSVAICSPGNPELPDFFNQLNEAMTPSGPSSEPASQPPSDDSNAASGNALLGSALSIGLGFVPVVGDMQDLIETVVGVDLASCALDDCQALDPLERAASSLGLIVGTGQMWRNVTKVSRSQIPHAASRWAKKIKDHVIRSADDVNEGFLGQGWKAPYKRGTKVLEGVTLEPEKFVRVHGPANQARPWMVKREAIAGLTPAQIKAKFSLKDTPTHISDVDVPAGTKIRWGLVESSWAGHSGAFQYEILDWEAIEPLKASSWFSKQRPIP